MTLQAFAHRGRGEHLLDSYITRLAVAVIREQEAVNQSRVLRLPLYRTELISEFTDNDVRASL